MIKVIGFLHGKIIQADVSDTPMYRQALKTLVDSGVFVGAITRS